jgi:hypothetical protein
MLRLMLVLGALMAAPITAPAAPVAQCRFADGATVALTGAAGAYEVAIQRTSGGAELSNVVERTDGRLDIETNGGAASLAAIGALFRELRAATSPAMHPCARASLSDYYPN